MASTKKTNVTTQADTAQVTDIAKTLREFRFGTAGSKGKNTALSKKLRRQRARMLANLAAAAK